MRISWALSLVTIGCLAISCDNKKRQSGADAGLASIAIDELNIDGYQRYEFAIASLNSGGFSAPKQSFQRGHGSIDATVPIGKYKIVLDYFNANEKIYSADYCADGLRNNDVTLIAGMNQLKIVICNAMKAPLNAQVVITPVLNTDKGGNPTGTTTQGGQTTGTFVAQNGWLKVTGTQLTNEKGEAVMLKGISSHGLQWNEGRFANPDAMKWIRDNWKVNLFRLAMYSAEGGYTQDSSVKNKVIAAADAAVNLGMYVVIDWHILSDGDPNTNKGKAKEFFAEMSARYKDAPNVLYEICNEPNGGNVTWQGAIKPYAEEVIPIIRQNSPRSVIIVGTGSWSQNVQDVADAPLSFANVMYTLHFYAGTHTQWLRDRVDGALSRGTPIFVTEWGTSTADGGGGNYFDESDRWIAYLNSKKISWINWSLTDKNESSAILKSGANVSGGWSDNDLTPSGQYVKKQF